MNTSSAILELQASNVRFFSQGDESAFFGWLASLPCVEQYKGQGRVLYISINVAAVDEAGLREMLALFRRYEVGGLRQFAAFDRDEFADWFRDKDAYWYTEVFG